MNIVAKAAYWARCAHIGQKRKVTHTPYWLHPARVAGLVSGFTTDDRVVAAAWLHDVVEDTDYTHTTIAGEFGPYIAHIVQVLTKQESGAPRKKRLQHYNLGLRTEQHVWEIDGNEGVSPAVLIKLADRYDNLREMEPSSRFFFTYIGETRDMLATLAVKHELVALIREWIEKFDD